MFVFLSSTPRIRRRLNIPAPHAAEHWLRVPTSTPRENLYHWLQLNSRRNLGGHPRIASAFGSTVARLNPAPSLFGGRFVSVFADLEANCQSGSL
jgi:hypothetical protein